jgi:hypothetical protein
METIHPWDTSAGLKARRAQLQLLAQDKGDVGEFAKEVIAGRAQYRDVLYSSILGDRHIGEALDTVDTWTRLTPEQRETMIADADTATEQLIAELNELDLEPEPPSGRDDDEQPGPILSDAW